MNKIEEIRLRSRVCEQVTEWAEDFDVSEDEIWVAIRNFAEYRVALRVSTDCKHCVNKQTPANGCEYFKGKHEEDNV